MVRLCGMPLVRVRKCGISKSGSDSMIHPTLWIRDTNNGRLDHLRYEACMSCQMGGASQPACPCGTRFAAAWVQVQRSGISVFPLIE